MMQIRPPQLSLNDCNFFTPRTNKSDLFVAKNRPVKIMRRSSKVVKGKKPRHL